MTTKRDDYQRGVDRLFQEMADREASAREQELFASLRRIGATDDAVKEARSVSN